MGMAMARIRIDQDAKEKLEMVSDKLDGTRSGLASEFIREGAEKLLETNEDIEIEDEI